MRTTAQQRTSWRLLLLCAVVCLFGAGLVRALCATPQPASGYPNHIAAGSVQMIAAGVGGRAYESNASAAPHRCPKKSIGHKVRRGSPEPGASPCDMADSSVLGLPLLGIAAPKPRPSLVHSTNLRQLPPRAPPSIPTTRS